MSRAYSLRAMENLIAEGKISRDVSCSSKIAYTQSGAVNAKRGFARRSKSRRGPKVRIYHCRFCNNYHLASG